MRATSSRLNEVPQRSPESGTAPVNVELARYREAWRQTLETVKATLADLEAAVVKDGVEPTPSITGLVERLVAVATAAAEAAGQQIRTEAQAEVARVQAELTRQRDELNAIGQSLAAERAARARAESALKDAEGVRRQVASAYESQIASLRGELELNRTELFRLQQQIDTERTERAGLIAAIKQVVKVDHGESNAPVPATSEEPSPVESQAAEVTIAPATAPMIATPVINGGTPDAEQVPDPDPELVAYARELLGKAEAMYWADVSARRNTSDLIDRLTSNLRRARLMFARRMGVTDLKETAIFEHQLAEALNTSEEPSFSRHLGIAAYESLSKVGR